MISVRDWASPDMSAAFANGKHDDVGLAGCGDGLLDSAARAAPRRQNLVRRSASALSASARADAGRQVDGLAHHRRRRPTARRGRARRLRTGR